MPGGPSEGSGAYPGSMSSLRRCRCPTCGFGILLVPVDLTIPNGYETTCQVHASQKNPDGTLEMVVLPLGAEPTENQNPFPSCGLLHRSVGAHFVPWGDAAGTPPWPMNHSSKLYRHEAPENPD